MTAWNHKHIVKVSTNRMPCACIDCFFWLAPWNPDDEETPCSCYLTGTTLPWNNDVTGEQRLPDCSLKLIRRKRQTNAGMIRNMSDEELAEWINTKRMCEQCANGYEPEDTCTKEPCVNGILKWLRSEAERNSNEES